ncbi:MAG TPA: ABC transporter permease [Terriglobales bacterium]|nr:ABC transporter permease [Terriglobales bacterium]
MLKDFRLALRTLRRSPGFALIAVAILGLGIGANTALFSALQATVLRALPYAQADRLVDVSSSSLRTGVKFATSWLDFQDWSRQAHAFTELAAYASGPSNLVGGAEPVRVQGTAATRDLFSILQVQPERGRTFSATSRAPEAVISDRLWRRQFGATATVLGKQIEVDSQPVTIVGVLAPGEGLPNDSDVWIPADLQPDTSSRSAHNWPGVIGRLQPGVSVATAQAEMSAIAQRLAEQYPDSNRGEGIAVTWLQTRLVGPTGFLLWLLLGAAGLVLLIVCANLASLYLVRATSRQREAALRLALGAGRWQLARQWIAEGLLLAVAGGVVGVWLAGTAAQFLTALLPAALPGQAAAGLNWTVTGFAFVLALATAALFAAAPVLQAMPTRILEQLKQGGARGGDGRRQLRMRQGLVVGEVALAMVVLAGAGVLLRSLGRLDGLDLGFQPQQRTIAQVSLSDKAQAQWTAILARLQQNPALRQASAATNLPLLDDQQNGGFAIAGRPVKPMPYAWYHVASPGYFQAMGIPLLRGRDFNERDTATAPGVAIIDRATAQLYFSGQDPMGKQLRFYGFDDKPQWLTVVGVVGDTQHGPFRAAPRQQIYTCELQHTEALGGMGIVAVGSGDVGGAIRKAVRQVNPDLPVTLTSMSALVNAATAAPRLRAELMGGFAGLAWLLSALGIYGVIAQEVLRRRRELGIRIALGAAPGCVVNLVLRQGLLLAGLGIGVGLLLAAAATRLLTTFLFETSAADPGILSLGGAALLATALAACYLPARRASRVSPVECLRAE